MKLLTGSRKVVGGWRSPGPSSEGRPLVVAITGASAGVGRATAVAFARRGAWVALIARGAEGLAAARREVEEAGGRALVLSLDVSDGAALEEAAAAIERQWGAIDVWVNNAMTSVFSPFQEMTADEFERVTRVTYLGTVNGTMAALRRMTARDGGIIIQVGSALAYRSIPLQSAYCGAKAGIRGFTDSLRCELRHDHSRVRLTMVHLPAMDTPQFGWVRSRLPRQAQPVPPLYRPEIAAEMIVYAAGAKRREIYVGWPTFLAIAVGGKLAPGLADRYLGRTGYESQQSDRPQDPAAPDNLYKPVEGDFGAHGRFGRQAHRKSPLAWATKHRGLMLGLGLAAAAVALALKTGRPQRRPPPLG